MGQYSTAPSPGLLACCSLLPCFGRCCHLCSLHCSSHLFPLLRALFLSLSLALLPRPLRSCDLTHAADTFCLGGLLTVAGALVTGKNVGSQWTQSVNPLYILHRVTGASTASLLLLPPCWLGRHARVVLGPRSARPALPIQARRRRRRGGRLRRSGQASGPRLACADCCRHWWS